MPRDASLSDSKCWNGGYEWVDTNRPRLGLLKNGESALHAASLYGHDAAVTLLLEHGADPMLKNDQVKKAQEEQSGRNSTTR